MIHGIYLKNTPKSKWHLVSVAASPEAANKEVDVFKKEASLKGNSEAQVGIQVFDSMFWIPEYINELKERKPLFN